MLRDLRELVTRWELELDAKPLWWRKHLVTAGATDPVTRKGAPGSTATTAPGAKLQRPKPRKVLRVRRASPRRPLDAIASHRGPADPASVTPAVEA